MINIDINIVTKEIKFLVQDVDRDYQPSKSKTINIVIVDKIGYLVNKEVVECCLIEGFGGKAEEKICLPSFISHQNGIVLRVLRRK